MSEASPYHQNPGQAKATGESGWPGQHGGGPGPDHAPRYAAGYGPGSPMVPPPARANMMGRVSLTLMIVATLVQYATSLMWRLGGGYPLALADTANYIQAGLAMIALVFGLVGLVRPGLPRGAAAAGTALATAVLASWLLNLVFWLVP